MTSNCTVSNEKQPTATSLWHDQQIKTTAMLVSENWLFTCNTIKFVPQSESSQSVYQLTLKNSFNGFYLTSFVPDINSTNTALFLYRSISLYRELRPSDWEDISVILINRKSTLSRLAIKGSASLLQNTINRCNATLKMVDELNMGTAKKSTLKTELNLNELEFTEYCLYVENLRRLNCPDSNKLYHRYPQMLTKCSLKDLNQPSTSLLESSDSSFLNKYLQYELKLAENYKKSHRYQQAITVIERVLFLYEMTVKTAVSVKGSCSPAELFNELGDLYYHLSDGLRASQYFNLSLQAAKKDDEQLFVARAYNMLAVLNFNSGNHQAADTYFKSAIKTLPTNKSGGLHHKIFEYQGKFALIKNEISKAFLYFEKLEKEAERLQDSRILLEAYYNLASTAFMAENYSKSVYYLGKYQHTARKTADDCYELLYGYDLMVGVFLKVQQYDHACKYLELLSKLATNFDNHFFLARANLRLGMILIRNKDYDGAYRHLLQAEHYYTINQNDRELKLVFFHLGELFFFKKQLKKAAGYLISARKASRVADHLFSTARIEHYLGLIAMEQQKYEKAGTHFNRQLQLAVQDGDEPFAILAQEALNDLNNKLEQQTERGS